MRRLSERLTGNGIHIYVGEPQEDDHATEIKTVIFPHDCRIWFSLKKLGHRNWHLRGKALRLPLMPLKRYTIGRGKTSWNMTTYDNGI